MKFVSFGYEVEARVTIKRDDVLNMLECARTHYDYECKKAGEPGQRGFLWGWRNRLIDGLTDDPSDDKLGAETDVDVTLDELDLLLKILESPSATDSLHESVSDVFDVLSKEYGRVNMLQSAQSRLKADEVLAVRCGECGAPFNGFECVTRLVRHRIAEHVRKMAST